MSKNEHVQTRCECGDSGIILRIRLTAQDAPLRGTLPASGFSLTIHAGTYLVLGGFRARVSKLAAHLETSVDFWYML